MADQVFKLKGEFIPLIGLLKLVGIAGTGGHAGLLVTEGQVLVNDEVELRKRRKIIIGDRIDCEGNTVLVSD